MIRSMRTRIALGIALLSFTSVSAIAQSSATSDNSTPKEQPSAQNAVDKRSIISQARRAYYSLHSQGLVEFQCNVTPNWANVLQAERKENPAAADAALKILNQLHFIAHLGSDGRVKVTHNEVSVQSQQAMEGLKQVYEGMEQMTSGFFDTWTTFMLSAPFPKASSEFQLTEVESDYQLAYKEGTADVVTTMGRDFAISSIRITKSSFDATIRPRFTKTAKGFVLSSYDANYQSNSPEETTRLKVSIDYQEVEGLQLARNVNLSGRYGSQDVAVQFSFSDCQATKK